MNKNNSSLTWTGLDWGGGSGAHSVFSQSIDWFRVLSAIVASVTQMLVDDDDAADGGEPGAVWGQQAAD